MDVRTGLLVEEIEMLPWNQRQPKSNLDSQIGRTAGNEKFKKGKFEAALVFYNASLCYAPAGSENIALAYGNRSAVYCVMGKYALAIENIKLARESGFPANKMTQLDAREEKCEKLMAEFGPDRNFDPRSFFKLSHPPNDKIPFIADCLELRKNEKYGRHIITTKDLKTGDIIAIETPAFVWPNHPICSIACSFCTKANDGSLIPCEHCTTVMYCSKGCQQKAAAVHFNDEFHEVDSDAQGVTLKMMLEAFRIAGGVNEALELLKDSEGKTIFDFDFSNHADPNYEKNMLIALNGLWKDIQSDEITKFDPKQLLYTFPINEKPRTSKKRKQLLKFIINQLKIFCSNMTSSRRANYHAIPLFRSLLNHSCSPNVIQTKFDEKSAIVVTRPTKAGEQIFTSYGVYASEKTKEERHEDLDVYPFECDCEAWPIDFPIKDRDFEEPEHEKISPEEAIGQFRKNCKYIDDNASKHPCYEIEALMDRNLFLLRCISGNFERLSLIVAVN